MSLLDTIDGSFMNFAYGCVLQTGAKVFFNLTITACRGGVHRRQIELLSIWPSASA